MGLIETQSGANWPVKRAKEKSRRNVFLKLGPDELAMFGCASLVYLFVNVATK